MAGHAAHLGIPVRDLSGLVFGLAPLEAEEVDESFAEVTDKPVDREVQGCVDNLQ